MVDAPVVTIPNLNPIVSGEFTDAHGIPVVYTIYAADGVLDLFRVDVAVEYREHLFRSTLEFSLELGTKFFSMKMKERFEDAFNDATNVMAMPVIIHHMTGRNFGRLVSECFHDALQKKNATSVVNGQFQ